MTIPVRNLTTAEEVFANARRLRDVFFHPRQIALAQEKAASEKAAKDAGKTQKGGASFPQDPNAIVAEHGEAAPVNVDELLRKFREVYLGRPIAAAPQLAPNTTEPVKEDEFIPRPFPITMREVQMEVVREFRVHPLDLNSERRFKKIMGPRHACMYLMKRYTNKSLYEIGRFLGGRDHTTVLNGVNRCGRLMAADPDFRAQIETIETALQKRFGGLPA